MTVFYVTRSDRSESEYVHIDATDAQDARNKAARLMGYIDEKHLKAMTGNLIELLAIEAIK